MFISKLNSTHKALKILQESNLGSLFQHSSRGEVNCSRWRAHTKLTREARKVTHLRRTKLS